MTSKELVDQMGGALIGRFVITEKIGAFSGGVRKIVEMAPDKAAPEIVFNVEFPEAERGDEKVMGIFEWENVVLCCE